MDSERPNTQRNDSDKDEALLQQETAVAALRIWEEYRRRSPVQQAMIFMWAYRMNVDLMSSKLCASTFLIEKLLYHLKVRPNREGERVQDPVADAVRRYLIERDPEANLISVTQHSLRFPTDEQVATYMRILTPEEREYIVSKTGGSVSARFLLELRVNRGSSASDLASIRSTLGLIHLDAEMCYERLVNGYRIYCVRYASRESDG